MSITCPICFHHCSLSEGQLGLCRSRICRGEAIVPVAYGYLTSLALDPIEKKPLHRFHPGSQILSIGSFGCNFHCPFCQNHTIAMAGATEQATVYVSPETLCEKAVELKVYGNIGIAYTYNEPLIAYEYVRDTARRIHDAGLYNVLVTNGGVAEGPWRELLPLIDAANIDLKGFTDSWYRRLGGDLETVKRSIAIACEMGCHVEVTTLVVPGENDSEDEMRQISSYLASLSPDIPLHVTRFFPRYQMGEKAPTPVPTIYRLAEVARAHLHYVYTGNC